MTLAKLKKLSPEERKKKAKFQRIFRVYGITEEQYVSIDNGYCPVCIREWSDCVRPNIDHDHVTGEIRGLLCSYCNHYRVGRHRDHELVFRIATYLKGPHTKWIVPPKPKKKRKKKIDKSIVLHRRSRSPRAS